MTQNIKVSVITASYNQGRFVEATILSVLGQSYKNVEYILVDGGSTDETMKIVERYRDKIDIVIHEKDNGQGDAINKGMKLASGELAGWINSDDLLYPRCIEEIVALYKEHPDGSVFYTPVIDIIDADGRPIRKYATRIPDRDFLLKKKYSICQPGSFYSAAMLKKIGFIDKNLHYCMDLDLWLRLLEHGRIYAIGDSSHAAIREWESTKTSTGGIKFLVEIRQTLLKRGARRFHPTIRDTYWYQFKFAMKKIIK